MDNAFEFYTVSVEEAKRALDEDVPMPTGVHLRRNAPKWVRLPQSPEDLRLRVEARQWLDALPPLLRPTACAQAYPRIVNRLAKLWGAPLFIREYLDELALDKRGERQGFPVEVSAELCALRDYYNRAFPRQERISVWSAEG